MDPLASKFQAWSPFNYVLGNPVGLVDLDGAAPNPPILVQRRSYRTIRFNGQGSHTVSRATHTRTFTGRDPNSTGSFYQEKVDISEVSFTMYATQIQSGLSEPSASATAVTHNSFDVSGFTGGQADNGMMLEGTQIFGRLSSSTALSEESSSSLDAPQNALLKSDVQEVANFLMGGGDGHGLAGTPLTVSGSFLTDPKKALINALVSNMISSKAGLGRGSAVGVAVYVATFTGLVDKVTSDKPEDHVGRNGGIDKDTGWIPE